MKTSNLYSLDYRDMLKGLLMAVGAPVILIIQQAIQDYFSGHAFVLNWQLIGMTALGAGITYLGKNFFTQATIKTVADSPTLVAKVETADPALTKSPDTI